MTKRRLALYSSTSLFLGSAALSQAPVQAPSNQVQDIVVTARRTSESLQTTPVAVTALSPKMLAQAQVRTIVDLAKTTPDLNISTGGAGPASLVFVSIRGQTQSQPSTSADSPVSTYIDGVYYARPTGGNLDLLDVKSAEILRGPQGTLFGRNTTGGAINIVTADPTSRFEGMVKAGVGNEGSRRVEAVLNVPVVDDQLDVRGAFRWDKNDGYGTFERLNGRDAGDVTGDYFGRVKVKWAPHNLPLTFVLAGDYERFRSSGQATTTTGLNTAFDLGGGFTVGDALAAVGFNPTPYLSNKSNFYKNYGYADTGFGLDVPNDKNKSYGTSGTFNIDLGGVKLKSITAYRRSITSDILDLDGLPINLVSFNSSYNQRQFSQELQLSGKAGKLDWIVGAYFFRESSKEFADSRSFAFLNPLAPESRGTSGDTRNISKGLFGQVNYHITSRLRVTAGIRYTWDDRHIVRHPLLDVSTGACAIPSADRDQPGGACNQTQDAKFSYPAWTFGFDYQLNRDLFLYVKTSGASEAGGWNLRGDFAPSFKPEKLRDVEGGVKADLFDRRVRLNLAIFHSWQYDAQRVVAGFDPTFNSSTQYVINSGNIHLYGLEAEGTILPWKGMEITATGSYLHSQYVKGTFIEQQTIASTGAAPDGCITGAPGTIVCSVDRGGERVPYAPKYNVTIGATQTFDLPFGSLAAHLDYSYTSSKIAYAATAAAQQPQSYKDQVAEANKLGVIQGYGLLSGIATLTLKDGIEASVWGKNLANKRYIQNIGDYYLAFGPVFGAVAPPRTYGVTVSYKW